MKVCEIRTDYLPLVFFVLQFYLNNNKNGQLIG